MYVTLVCKCVLVYKKCGTVKHENCFLLKMNMCLEICIKHSREVKFVYISLHKQLQLNSMTSTGCRAPDGIHTGVR